MKAALPLFTVLVALTACRTTTPPARNTMPRHQALTETTSPETAEPTRQPGPALPDSSRRAISQQP
ncbi:hypothetical protein [Hymenobacter terrenus]|uniref:hypothetical protein n=1 Tax=Hymenobacter terrenus TaxID=1629124 RepID=UPI0012E01980|nr:hypothetical protein [Hymenobacter terrenus]